MFSHMTFSNLFVPLSPSFLKGRDMFSSVPSVAMPCVRLFLWPMFMHYIHIGQAPKYLSDCVSTVSAASGRYQLRSTGSAAYVLPRTRTKFSERGFFYSGPAAWNTLPSDLHDITDTSTFRKQRKNVLVDRAYN